MTSPPRRPKLRSVRLALHPGLHGTSWSLILRTDDGHTVFDRRLHSGQLESVGRVDGPSDVSGTLRAIADEIDRRWGLPPADGGSGAPGGGGGRPGRSQSGEHPRRSPDHSVDTP